MPDNQNPVTPAPIRQPLAFGGPGLEPKWTSSAKSGIGTALSGSSRVWFTMSHGILNEVYFPRVDLACIRDLGLVVTDGNGFFSEEKRDTSQEISTAEPGIPAFKSVNTCLSGQYRVTKYTLSDPKRDVVLQKVVFEALQGPADKFRVFALLAPHLVNGGANNTGWVGDYKGHTMLFAEGAGTFLALACDPGWLIASAGFVGSSDGWQDLSRHGGFTHTFDRAENGNIGLTAQADLSASAEFVMALGFGHTAAAAANRALSSLMDGFDAAHDGYVSKWRSAHQKTRPLPPVAGEDHQEAYLTSVAVMMMHQTMSFPGALIASLSIPWGQDKGDDDLGGYHLVWPRDLGETAGGLMACGWGSIAVEVISYLQSVQEADGHWPQNMWLDGAAYWGGIQLDETAFPILLVGMAMREGLLDEKTVDRFFPMVRKAASYLVTNGPVTGQDRWEEDPGYSPFTLAAIISGVLVAADILEAKGEATEAAYCRDVADLWNDGIESWTYAENTDLCQQLGIDGYYVRIAPPETSDGASPLAGFVAIKNRPVDQTNFLAAEVVSPDALALVRFGLRAPDDPRILNTVKVIDHLLRVELPQGSVWRRYNGDGYGEHEDGSSFDGTGIGRAWPLLAGERAHYELALGDKAEAARLLGALEQSANEGRLLPEQVWESPDIPDRELFLGKPSGSAMPLVWAHSEHVKLLRSLADGKVFDMPDVTVERYQKAKITSPYSSWRFNHKCRDFQASKILRIEVAAPAMVHWSVSGWSNPMNAETRDTGLGMYVVDLPTASLPPGTSIIFTFFWTDQEKWEGADFQIMVRS